MKLFWPVLFGTIDGKNQQNIPWNSSKIWQQCDESRIVGGQQSQAGKWPFLIKFEIGCGGSIIHDSWVITAAHCCENTNSFEAMQENLAAKICPLDRENCIDKLVPISMSIHPKYDSVDYKYDFCLIQYPTGSFSKYTKICPSYEPLNADTICYIAGWGVLTDKSKDTSQYIHEAVVPVLDWDSCNLKEHYNGAVKESSFCAGSFSGGVDSCQGDSGGPVVCIEDDEPVLQGIISWGVGCARKTKPGVYARLEYAESWFKSTIANNGELECSQELNFDENEKIIIEISEEDYLSNTLCNFHLKSDTNIQFDILEIDIENQIYCDHDFFSISQLKSPEDRNLFNFPEIPESGLLKKICGSCEIESFVVSNEFPLVLAFRSNAQWNFTGLKLKLSKTEKTSTYISRKTSSNINCDSKCTEDCSGKCENKVYNGTSTGSLTSHIGFENGLLYSSFLSCQWIIDLRNVQDLNKIILTFTNIELEGDGTSACTLDYVNVFDQDDVNMLEFCFEQFRRYRYAFDTDYLRIVFITDYETNYGGFALSWEPKLKTQEITEEIQEEINECGEEYLPANTMAIDSNKNDGCSCVGQSGCQCWVACQYGFHFAPVDVSTPVKMSKKMPKITCKRRDGWIYNKIDLVCRSNEECHQYPRFKKIKNMFFIGRPKNRRLSFAETKILDIYMKVNVGDMLVSRKKNLKNLNQDWAYFFVCGFHQRCNFRTLIPGHSGITEIKQDDKWPFGRAFVTGNAETHTSFVRMRLTLHQNDFEQLFHFQDFAVTWDAIEDTLLETKKIKLVQNFEVGVVPSKVENFDCV